jgi:hypothetical protein
VQDDYQVAVKTKTEDRTDSDNNDRQKDQDKRDDANRPKESSNFSAFPKKESPKIDISKISIDEAEDSKPQEPANIESAMLGSLPNDQPVAVVKTLSVRGLEYLFMSVALWFGAAGLAWTLLAVANNAASFESLALPVTFLLVSLPVFALFFLRLKKAELANPALRFDPSKRRLSQITQVVAFLACFINAITFVYMILTKVAGGGDVSIGKAVINLLIILAVAGGVLAYYWHDEHRSFKKI